MGGGVLQLVAYGPQDIYLTGNPQMSYFKAIYRRHTNFSIECIEQTFDSAADPLNSCRRKCIVSRNGDLIYDAHLEVNFKKISSFPKEEIDFVVDTGHAYLKSIGLLIGGQLIDKQNSQWMNIKTTLKDKMDSKSDMLNSGMGTSTPITSTTSLALDLFIPLEFWFCRKPGSSIPIIGLQYHEVEFDFEFRGFYELLNTTSSYKFPIPTPTEVITTKFYVDYIFLDTEERRRFAQTPQEYLIEQVQYQSNSIEDINEMFFSNPVKELIWICQDKRANIENQTTDGFVCDRFTDVEVPVKTDINNNYFNYHANGLGDNESYIGNEQYNTHIFSTAELFLNDVSRFNKRKNIYFSYYQTLLSNYDLNNKHQHNIYMYSFALNPGQLQPTGTCNFSRIKKSSIVLEGVDSDAKDKFNLNIFAVNYNILKIQSGMGGLVFSN